MCVPPAAVGEERGASLAVLQVRFDMLHTVSDRGSGPAYLFHVHG